MLNMLKEQLPSWQQIWHLLHNLIQNTLPHVAKQGEITGKPRILPSGYRVAPRFTPGDRKILFL